LVFGTYLGYCGVAFPSFSFCEPDIALNQDGTVLASSSVAGVDLWNVSHSVHNVPAFRISLANINWTRSVAFSPNGHILAIGTGEARFSSASAPIQLYDMTHRVPLGPALSGHTQEVTSIMFNRSGTLLASGSKDGTIRLWDVQRRRPLATLLTGHSAAVNRIAFSPNGRFLASAGADGSVQLWNVALRQPAGPPLAGPSGAIQGIAFSPDGSMLAAGGTDHSIWLWDVASQELLGPPLKGDAATVTSLDFSPDGKVLAAGYGDRTVQTWLMDQELLRIKACRIVNRNFTRQEWQQYLGDLPYHRTCPSLPAGM
jgi:WD40 repeat protein